jgi:cell division protein FtsQ
VKILFSGKIFRWLCVLIVVIALIIVYVWLSNPRSFPIKNVQVKGSYSHESNQALENIITPYVHTSIFGLSASALQQRLLQLPWLADVNIRRVFPATIVITLQEKQPIYVWNDTALMTADGTAFTPALETFPSNLPKLIGPDDQQQLLFSTMEQINQLLQPLNITVQQLTLSDRGSWSMVLSNGIAVMIGKQNLWDRLQQFVTVYPKVIGPKAQHALSVDLRYPNGFAIQWKH